MSADAQVESNTTDGARAELSLAPPARRAWQRWLAASRRSTQFVIAAALILGVTMSFVGNLVSQQIRLAAAHSAGEGAAIYMEAYLDEYIQELTTARQLSPASIQAMDSLMRDTSLNQHVVSVKIWLPDGTNLYSSSKLPAYPRSPMNEIRQALQGRIVTGLSELENDEHAYERSLNIPLYETYVPLREVGSGRVLAVGEFYEMEHEIGSIHQEVWVTIGGATLAMLVLLFFIVRRGDRIIEQQQVALCRQMNAQAELHRQNGLLQQKVTRANHEFATINELTHRRLGADLHDGPAQLLTLILLRLDELSAIRDRCPQSAACASEALETIRSAAQESLREIRDISRGLALPEINALNLEEELRLVTQRHEQRTQTQVQLTLDSLPAEVPLPYKICIYRLVQEALNNAFRHAGGREQRVRTSWQDGVLEVEIADGGDGIAEAPLHTQRHDRVRLGLVGMRYRVESLGGLFSIDSAPGQGTRIRVRFNLAAAHSAAAPVTA
ncbi:Signal transduction histidine-protein kinase/phosphatase DegS [compost metagenome]